MIALLRRAFRRGPYITTGFLIALALTLFFGLRGFLGALHWSDPARRDPPIAGWMTPRHVALSWDVPQQVILEALSLPRPGDGPAPQLDDIAATRGTSVEALADRIEAAIAAHRDAP